MKKIFLYLICLSFLASCDDSNEPVSNIPLQVTNPEIIPVGEIETENQLSLTLNNDTAKCTIRTMRIYENDTISNIDAYVKGKIIHIIINTNPDGAILTDDKWIVLPPDNWVHDIKFNLTGVRKQRYAVKIQINGYADFKQIIMDLGNTDYFSTNF